jgi:deoxyribonuclease IV
MKHTDEVGAHVSTAGGIAHAPARAASLKASVLQLFTKQPSRWAEPVVTADIAREFKSQRHTHRIRFAGAHDSYLINLASPDRVLQARSYDCFRGELERASVLGLDFVVTHPGNATDGDTASGLARNAEAIQRALEEVDSPVRVLLETTAGCGTALGCTFEQLALLIERVSPPQRNRLGICLDTCHVWVAGYDVLDDYDGVFAELDDRIGLDRLRLFHCNDSVGARDSRRDRHAEIGAGTLGSRFFSRLMQDERLASVPKLIETPKGDDHVRADRRNIGRLRRYRAAARAGKT